jgi:hypothetical protein
MSPRKGGIDDTLIGFPADPDQVYASVRRSLRDHESRDEFTMPAAYMFHDRPEGQIEPLKDEVWPKFLRYNAARILGLDTI